MTMSNINGVSDSNKLKELQHNYAVSPSTIEQFNSFQLVVLVFGPATPLSLTLFPAAAGSSFSVKQC